MAGLSQAGRPMPSTEALPGARGADAEERVRRSGGDLGRAVQPLRRGHVAVGEDERARASDQPHLEDDEGDQSLDEAEAGRAARRRHDRTALP